MLPERIVGGTSGDPFPIYGNLVQTLAAAHQAEHTERDATIAHALGTCAAYAYGDADTVATMMTRLGLERHGCVRISRTIDAMLISSTAYLVQSECGRIVILCYRGTQPTVLTDWLSDLEVGSESSTLSLANGAETVRVHAGFHRNVRATWSDVIHETTAALQGRSLANPDAHVEHTMEALYVCGHSLGGAMAALFALIVCGNSRHKAIADRLRAVYTFGQPMVVAEPVPHGAQVIEERLFRHILTRDPIPVLPAAPWGLFVHVGQEYRYSASQWRRAETPLVQLATAREIPRAALAFFAGEKRQASFRYTLAEHLPHHYLDALRPGDRVTEFGD